MSAVTPVSEGVRREKAEGNAAVRKKSLRVVLRV